MSTAYTFKCRLTRLSPFDNRSDCFFCWLKSLFKLELVQPPPQYQAKRHVRINRSTRCRHEYLNWTVFKGWPQNVNALEHILPTRQSQVNPWSKCTPRNYAEHTFSVLVSFNITVSLFYKLIFRVNDDLVAYFSLSSLNYWSKLFRSTKASMFSYYCKCERKQYTSYGYNITKLGRNW